MSAQSARYENPSLSSAYFRHIFVQLLEAIRECRAGSAIRRSLGAISDRQMRDAGLIRYDVEAACSRELSHPAGSELKAAARRRIGNW